jgi:DNA-binding winged helix-turn-helix (wHTH) protein/tetratricopeptide (TPR) repeat protein
MAARSSPRPDFWIGDWLVRPSLAKIQRREETVHLSPRAMAVLVYLADAGGVVPRNELLDAVWPRMAVTQDALSQCIVELRKAFGESSKQPRVFETIPKVGIRLMAPAVAADAEDGAKAADASRPVPPPAVTMRFPLWQRVALAAASIAIAAGAAWLWLPKSLGRGPENVDEIATTSSRARDCFTSAEEYMQRTNRADALPSEERLYRCAVEEDPSFALAWARLSRTHLGMYWHGIDRTSGRLALGKEAIDRALTLDPELPEGHLYFANYLYRGKHDYEAALSEFAVAERLAPGNAEVYFLRASLYRRQGKWDLSIRDGEKAIELDPTNMAYLREQHGSYLFQRDYERADALLDRILDRLRDDDGATYVDKALLALYRNGDTQPAHRFERVPPTADYEDVPQYSYVTWLAAVIDRDNARALNVLEREDGDPVDAEFPNSPNLADKTLFFARTYALAGDDERARAAFEAALRDITKQLADSSADDSLGLAAFYVALGEAHAGLGERQAALDALTKARSLAPKSKDALVGSSVQLQAVIRVLIPLGDHAPALSELEDYLRGPGLWSIEALALDPRLDPIRGDAHFAALVERYGRH